MFLNLKDRLGVPGVIAVVALVFAMAGGAWAASGKLTSTQKKEVKKIAKSVAKPGPQGPQGQGGSQGSAGKDGTNGSNGSNGTNGQAGAPVIVANEAPLGCAEGGVTYEVKGSGEENEVCNGEEGEDGSPWVAGKAPSGVVLKGTWAVGPFTAGGGEEPIPVAISTGVPVPNKSAGEWAFAFDPGTCPGTATAPLPPTTGGTVCLYASANSVNIKPAEVLGAEFGSSEGGIVGILSTEAAGPGIGWGTWAVKTP
jgi:hypothetical protein